MFKIVSAFEDDGREYFFALEILFKNGEIVSSAVATGSSFLKEEIEEQVSWLESLRAKPENLTSFFPQVRNKELFPSLQILPFPEVENAYTVVSFFTVSKGKDLRSRVSFLYRVNPSLIAEWEIESSDFILYRACDKHSPEAARHFFFEATADYGEVIEFKAAELGLAQQVKAGNFKEVFKILKTFGEGCA